MHMKNSDKHLISTPGLNKRRAKTAFKAIELGIRKKGEKTTYWTTVHSEFETTTQKT